MCTIFKLQMVHSHLRCTLILEGIFWKKPYFMTLTAFLSSGYFEVFYLFIFFYWYLYIIINIFRIFHSIFQNLEVLTFIYMLTVWIIWIWMRIRHQFVSKWCEQTWWHAVASSYCIIQSSGCASSLSTFIACQSTLIHCDDMMWVHNKWIGFAFVSWLTWCIIDLWLLFIRGWGLVIHVTYCIVYV